nr:type II toxin-antitoxin system RelE/ParE family toxin [Agrobacterium sp. a22-2]
MKRCWPTSASRRKRIKRRRVIWSTKARRDLRRMYRHIAQYSPKSADDFVGDLYRKMNSLAELGLTGTSKEELGVGIRLLVYRDRRFYIRVTDDTLSVLKVAHGHQNITSDDFTESSS